MDFVRGIIEDIIDAALFDKIFDGMTVKDTDEYIQNLKAFGTVLHFTEGNLVVVPEPPLLELETKAALETGKVVGILEDIIGNVDRPLYIVQAYERQDPGTILYASAVSSILASVSTKPGTDASNKNDQEKSESSDSEEESHKTFSILKGPIG